MGILKTNSSPGGRILELEEQIKTPIKLFELQVRLNYYSSVTFTSWVNPEYYEITEDKPYYKVVKALKAHKLLYCSFEVTRSVSTDTGAAADLSMSGPIFMSPRNMLIGSTVATSNYGSLYASSSRRINTIAGFLGQSEG